MNLAAAFGIGDAERRVLLDRLPALAAGAPPEAVLLGMLVGLFAADT